MRNVRHLDPYEFRIEVPDATLDDLGQRLARTRWPVEPAAQAWRYGTDGEYLRSLMAHWRDRYDWRATEARLNILRQYRVPIDDLSLHVVVASGSGSTPLPLVLLNGWPSSFIEFERWVERLAHPERFGGDAEDGMTVIIPSYPGFGFSDPPPVPVGARAIAGMIDQLVTVVAGPGRYALHGGDWGAIIGSWMALDRPDRVAALHLTSAPLRHPNEAAALDADDLAFLAERARRLSGETGYQAIQSTKPQSLSPALTDSPVGLAAWIVEKFHGWTNYGSTAPPPFTHDTLIDHVMVHWVNGIAAANWLYTDMIDGVAATLAEEERVSVPTAIDAGRRDLVPLPPERWIRRCYDLVEVRTDADMGHFPWLEPAGEQLCNRVRSFVRRYG